MNKQKQYDGDNVTWEDILEIPDADSVSDWAHKCADTFLVIHDRYSGWPTSRTMSASLSTDIFESLTALFMAVASEGGLGGQRLIDQVLARLAAVERLGRRKSK